MDMLRSTLAPSLCFGIWRWREPTAVCAVYSSLSRIDLLVIDDWPWRRGRNLSAATSGRFARIATEYSTILTSQLSVSRWHEQIDDPRLTD